METRLISEKRINVAEFKSYYVVWKQNKNTADEKEIIGLNRTM